MNDRFPDKLTRVHTILAASGIPHAFGGAIALAFYGEPRATTDIDINIALPPAQKDSVLDALSLLFPIANRRQAEEEITRLAQVRLLWQRTAIDLFFADIPFHDSVAARSHDVDYMGASLPIVSAEDLVILKAAFNRPKDWLDIENMFAIQRHALDPGYLRRWLAEFYDPKDLPLQRVEAFIRRYQQQEGSE